MEKKHTGKAFKEGENQIIKALAEKGWKDAIAYYGPETFGSEKQVWTSEFEINHCSDNVYDKQLAVSKMNFNGAEYNGDGVINADTLEAALEIISKLPNYK